jgi:hypothetical protein
VPLNILMSQIVVEVPGMHGLSVMHAMHGCFYLYISKDARRKWLVVAHSKNQRGILTVSIFGQGCTIVRRRREIFRGLVSTREKVGGEEDHPLVQVRGCWDHKSRQKHSAQQTNRKKRDDYQWEESYCHQVGRQIPW